MLSTSRLRRTSAYATVLVALALPSAALAAEAETAPSAEDPHALTEAQATVAEIVHAVRVRDEPNGRMRATLQPIARWGGGPVRLLVLSSKTDDLGVTWLHVRLPSRPNDAAGWIPRDSARLSTTNQRIEISRKSRRLRLLRAGTVVISASVVVGKPSTPTPAGLFAINEMIRQPRTHVIGPWALHLTAHSNVLDSFDGGPGRVAIHGRRGRLLNDPLGTASSRGCIRMDNKVLLRIVNSVRPGTPVVIS